MNNSQLLIKQFTKEYSFLSNFYSCKIIYKDTEFSSTEQAYQWAKCDNDKDKNKILKALKPGVAKTLGKHVTLIDNWEDKKINIMLELLRIKFSQESLRTMLLATKDALLIEGNYWHDNFWGVCFCKRCFGGLFAATVNAAHNNNLGRLLMQIREELKNIVLVNNYTQEDKLNV